MHDIEPYWNWRDRYIASEDKQSPFFGRVYSEFSFTHKIYNYFIHPQWDEFGSSTLYLKPLYVDYDKSFVIIELIGEWNDCLHNDIMFLKRNVVDQMIETGISKFILVGENVLNFHGGDSDYYQEWQEEVAEMGGWISFVNFRDHVMEEMEDVQLQFFVNFDPPLNDINWRAQRPTHLLQLIDALIKNPNQFRLRG
ncbi:MAG: hypothetical protein AAF502_15345 [Bacteroidota bacterium]